MGKLMSENNAFGTSIFKIDKINKDVYIFFEMNLLLFWV